MEQGWIVVRYGTEQNMIYSRYTFTDDDVCVVLENLFVQILILGKVQISYDIFVLNLFEEIFLFLRLITGLGIRI
jgi:hypothetical protein